MNEKWLKALAASSLLSGVDADDLTRITAFTEIREFAALESIYETGDPADNLYILLSGRIRFTSLLNDGELSETTLFGGGAFGSSGILPKQPKRRASALCLEPTVVAVIDGELFLDIANNDAPFREVVLPRLPELIRNHFLQSGVRPASPGA